ncbi:MAG: dockerin type I domain-containing protein [Eubacteriales bacterium]
MRKKIGKVLAFTLAVSMLCTPIFSSTTYAAGDEEYTITEDDTYVMMDEEGNITVIAAEDVETPDVEHLEQIDNVQYEIIVEIEGEESVVTTVETEVEAEEHVEEIQKIIDEQPTVEAAVVEIVETIEIEEVPEVLEQIVIEATGEQPVAEISDSEERANEEAQGSYSATSESASTQSASIDGIGSAAVASEKAITVTAQQVTQAVEYGVVIFTASGTITFTDVNSGAYIPYVSSSMSPDAAYLGTNSSGQIMFMQSGIVGLVDASKVSVVDYDTFVSQGKITNYYYTTQGKLYHAITTNSTSVASSQVIGYQQSYMTDGGKYYSFDGKYFYTDYKTMITDYKNNTYANSINASSPYYNYYLYLSHRTTTNFTADQLNEYIASKTTSSSKLYNAGAALIENQNTYGVNALLMLGVAINESAWGLSSYALNRNNLFGHSAYDSDPNNADYYSSVSECIMYHASKFVSTGYCDATTDSRYHGSHLGNKQSGMNVKYASDPYWGEKAAANAWLVEMYFSDSTIDACTETLGIVNNSASIYAEVNGTVLYSLKNYKMSTSWEMPVVILGQTTVDGEVWYKIQSDIAVNDARTGVDCYLQYNYTDDYVYIKASDVYIAYGTVFSTEGYSTGDVSGDGVVSTMDYILVKNHIMGVNILTDTQLDTADVNRDGSVSTMDYILVKNHIMGVIALPAIVTEVTTTEESVDTVEETQE